MLQLQKGCQFTLFYLKQVICDTFLLYLFCNCIYDNNMTDVINEITKDNIDCNYNISIRKLRIKDKSDEGKQYNKTICYMENKSTIDSKLLEIMDSESTYVRKVVRYIALKIPYGVNHISLNSNEIGSYFECDAANIRKGIKRLVELDVIRRLYDYKPNNILPKNTYIINHNYIYHGNIKKLNEDIIEQRNNIQKD